MNYEKAISLLKSKAIIIVLLLLATVFILSRLGNDLPDEIEGVWVRQDDKYAGMMMEFSGEGENGVLIYVPELVRQGGFQVGDVKVKNIEEVESDEYECGSLVKTADYGRVSEQWYDQSVVYIRDGKELIFRQKKGSDMTVGEWQRWIRLEDAEEFLGKYHYGKATLSEVAGDEKTAIKHFEKAIDHDGENALFLNGLAWRLAIAKKKNLRDGEEAVEWAKKACDLTDYM